MKYYLKPKKYFSQQEIEEKRFPQQTEYWNEFTKSEKIFYFVFSFIFIGVFYLTLKSIIHLFF
tara:strand:+ start:388 stop:576 length:189 start_codon:yes stop_codon:yes gene_type:complete